MTIQTEDFFQEIQGSVLALESICAQASQDYYDTPRLLGKPWYGIALEFLDTEKQTDSANKNDVIRRMVEAIMNFIKMLIEKFKALFASQDKQKIEKNQDFLNRYKSITADKQKLLSFAESKPAAAEPAAAPAAGPKKRPGAHARPVVPEKSYTAVTKKIVRDIGTSQAGIFRVIMQDEFFKPYLDAHKLTKEIIKSSVKAEGLVEKLEQIQEQSELIDACRRALSEASNLSEDDKMEFIDKWTFGDDFVTIARCKGYINDGLQLDDVTKYAEDLAKLVKSLEHESSEEAVEALKAAQKILTGLTAIVTLVTKAATVSNAATTAWRETFDD